MQVNHPIGLFEVSEEAVRQERKYDTVKSVEIAAGLCKNPDSNMLQIPLLVELRKQEYEERLVSINLTLAKKQIASSVSEDTFIIQAINSIEDLNKICNTLAKRLREWYGYYYPELSHSIVDNEVFVRRICEKSKHELMIEYGLDGSMGPDIDQKDSDEILRLARQVSDIYDERARLVTYIDNIMMRYCPNLYTITGSLIGAKLIERAGSLKTLSKMPSSTVQLLGAEKALFRHLRNKKIRPPKHGLILSHYLVMNAPHDKKGSASRLLAAKISIASKVDYFKGEFIGDRLVDELKKQLVY